MNRMIKYILSFHRHFLKQNHNHGKCYTIKRCLLSAFGVLLFFPGISTGDEFLGLPVVPGAKVLEKTEDLLVIESNMTHDQAIEFFMNVLKDEEDIKIREWESASYIEDDGARPWHSISIPKQGQEQARITITIKKDSWSWIFSTLILRYIAVFVILIIIYASLLFSGNIISNAIKKAEQKKAARAG